MHPDSEAKHYAVYRATYSQILMICNHCKDFRESYPSVIFGMGVGALSNKQDDL